MILQKQVESVLLVYCRGYEGAQIILTYIGHGNIVKIWETVSETRTLLLNIRHANMVKMLYVIQIVIILQ